MMGKEHMGKKDHLNKENVWDFRRKTKIQVIDKCHDRT